jgi:hypothetical protein
MNRLYIYLGVLLLIPTLNAADTGIRLTAPALKYIDGVAGFVDKYKVGKMIWLGHQLGQLQLGIYNSKTQKREPQFTYNGQLYTLQQLVKLEEKIGTNSTLTQLLAVGKSSFEQFSGSFFKEARGSEQYMYDLIRESCQKRKRTDSLLILWSKSMLDNSKAGRWYDGIEYEVLRQQVTSIKKLYNFCNDLTNFLKDLVRSCPKALHQYKEWIKQQHHIKNTSYTILEELPQTLEATEGIDINMSSQITEQ